MIFPDEKGNLIWYWMKLRKLKEGNGEKCFWRKHHKNRDLNFLYKPKATIFNEALGKYNGNKHFVTVVTPYFFQEWVN